MATYQYFKTGKFLVCLDQALLNAFRRLGPGYKRHQLASIGLPVKAARGAIKAVARSKLGLLHADNIVEMPVFGEIGMQVHGGCKIFDLGRRTVAKVFSPGTSDSSAAREIAASQQASDVPAAPRFIDADPDMSWYREEFVCGTHATDPAFRGAKAIADFYPAVEECLLGLVATDTVLEVDASSHFARLAGSSFREGWLESGQSAEHVDEIASYMDALRDWLAGQSQAGQLKLVPVHGDFSLVNAIATDDGLRFIDWEGIAPGCVYDDIFNFLFVERHYGRATDTFMEDVATFLSSYGKAVRERHPELRDATEVDLTFARRQYYLERISLLLDRYASDNLCKVIRNSIAMFREFDREAGDDDVTV